VISDRLLEGKEKRGTKAQRERKREATKAQGHKGKGKERHKGTKGKEKTGTKVQRKMKTTSCRCACPSSNRYSSLSTKGEEKHFSPGENRV